MASVRNNGFFSISLLAATVAIVALLNPSMAANYTVGGPNGGWDATTDLQTWSTSQTFQVRDNLIFQYAPSHDVVEVPQTDYDSCSVTSALQSYTGGASVVPLTSAGDRYFICGMPGHCSGGMKLQVNVLAITSPSPASATATPEQSPASSPAAGVEDTPPASSSSVPFPTADSPAGYPEMSPMGPKIPVLESSPAYSPASVAFPTGTSALTPPVVASSAAGGNGFRVDGISAGVYWLAMIAMVLA